MTLTKAKAKANSNNYTRQNHKVKHNYHNKTNYFMESGDSCSRLRMSFQFHLGQNHQSEVTSGKKFWRALDAYRRDHGKVDKGNLFGSRAWRVMTGTWGWASGWLCQLWRIVMRILVHTW